MPANKLPKSTCSIFYRVSGDVVIILYVMRAEKLLKKYILEERTKNDN